MDEVSRIRDEFKSGDLYYIDAIDELIEHGLDQLDAESKVVSWEEEMESLSDLLCGKTNNT